MPVIVYAKSEITLETDKTALEVNDEVIVKAKLESDTKLYALTATFSYDENIFEEINDSNFTSMDDWSDILYNPTNNKFGLINKSGEVLENLLSIKLKVKEDCNVGDTKISLSNISASDGSNKYVFADSSVSVFVSRDAKEGEAIPNNKEKEDSIVKEETKKVKSNGPIIIGIEIVVILFLIVCILANLIKVKNKKKITIVLFSIVVVSLGILGYLFYSNSQKSDINNDGVKDYEDAKEIIKYLIDMEGTLEVEDNSSPFDNNYDNSSSNGSSLSNTSSNNNDSNTPSNTLTDVPSSNPNTPNNPSRPSNPNKPNGDVDNDGDVDIDDAGDIVDDTTNRHYTVKLSEIKTKDVYFKKDEEIMLSFSAVVKPNELIKKVYIDGTYYDVINNSTYYSVILPASLENGVKKIQISKVMLANKREINASLEFRVEVLKDEPFVRFFKVDEETKEVSFELVDEEDTWSDGNVFITNADGDIVYSNVVVKGINKFNYNFSRDEKYRLTINGNYDLDTNSLNNITGDENVYSEAVLLEKEVCIGGIYNFKINDLVITDIVNKNEDVTIFFNSVNDSVYKPDYIIIDGVSYKIMITDKENEYKVVLPSKNEYGTYKVNISEIVLSNGKSFTVNKELTYNVLKSEPKVSNIVLNALEEEKKIKVSYELVDKDMTISSLVAVLIDGDGNEIARSDAKDLEFSYSDSEAYKFTVMFIADYDLGPSFKYSEQAIGQKDIYISPSVYFTNVSANKVYANKNEEIYVYYELHVPANFKPSGYPKNITNLITGMTINGLNYVATRNSESNEIAKYTVSFKVPNESGVLDVLANKVNFFDSSIYWMEPIPLKIEVLKDKPVIKNFRLDDESYEKQEATFSFDVVSDNGGFDSGYITLGEEHIAIHSGENTVTFKNIPLDEKLDIKVYGNYDLDTNSLDSENNYYEDDELFTFTYGLYDSSNYENINLLDVLPISSNNNVYFEKNEDIRLDFKVEGLNVDFDVAKLNVLDTYYDVVKNDDSYSIIMKGFNNAGVKHFIIYELLLANGKKVALNKPVEVSLEVLKSKLDISDFAFQVNDNNIALDFKVNDDDESLANLMIKVVDEDDVLIGNYKYSDKITFNKKDNVTRYYVTGYANYDLDTNALTSNDNYYSNVLVLDEVVSLDKNNIELKDITDIILYKNNQEIEKVNLNDIKNNLSSYFVKISMSKMPTIYSKVKSILTENNHLFLVLDYEDLKIDFGKISNNYVSNSASPETFDALMERLEDDPSGTFILDHDYDASSYNEISDLEFKGIIDGNGHSIKNLKQSLFKSISGGEIKNIKLVNVMLPTNNARGSLANIATDTKFSNILIEGFEKTNSENNVGSLVGDAINCEINTSKVSGFKMSSGIYNNQLGGLVGSIRNTTINNCYFNGTISGGWQNLGGIVGNTDDKSTINNCYSKGSVVNSFGYASYLSLGGIAGSSNGTFNNNVSLITTEYGYGISEVGNSVVASNNYQLANMGYTLNEGEGFNTINREVISKDFFINNAKFSEDIWDFKNISFDNLPTLKVEFSLSNEVLSDELYDKNKDILYHNLSLLTPFYDNKRIVKNGSSIPVDHILNQEEIKHIIPLDSNGNIVTYLTNKDYRKISKIKIILGNDKVLDYSVRYDNLYNNVVGYRINELKIDYTYNHYLIDESSLVVNELVSYLSSLDYTKDLDSLTVTNDSRLYRDYYNEVTKNELKEFVLKYLSNSDSNINLSDRFVGNYIVSDLKKDNKLKKVLYVYNYFRRFYSF